MRESKIQGRCLKWVKSERPDLLAVNIHMDGYSNKGFPDVLVFGYGRAVAIEMKSDSGYELQEDQVVWRNRFIRARMHHYVPNTFDEFVSIIEKEFGYGNQVQGQ